jgi:hypothetical protein
MGVAPLIEGAITELKARIAQVNTPKDPVSLRALWFAIDHLGDTGYGAGGALGSESAFASLGENGQSKCNIFVADCYGSVVGYGDLHGVPLYHNWFMRTPASANELGDQTVAIPDFPGDTMSPQPGDIAGFSEPDYVHAGGHGHSALVVGNGVLIYAGAYCVKLGDLETNQIGHNQVYYRHYSW